MKKVLKIEDKPKKVSDNGKWELMPLITNDYKNVTRKD